MYWHSRRLSEGGSRSPPRESKRAVDGALQRGKWNRLCLWHGRKRGGGSRCQWQGLSNVEVVGDERVGGALRVATQVASLETCWMPAFACTSWIRWGESRRIPTARCRVGLGLADASGLSTRRSGQRYWSAFSSAAVCGVAGTLPTASCSVAVY